MNLRADPPTRQSSRGPLQRSSPPELQSLKESPGQQTTDIETLSSTPRSCHRGSCAPKDTRMSETLTLNQN